MFLSIVRGVGTTEAGSVKFEIWTSLLVSLIFGVFFGAIAGIAEIIMEERAYKRISLGRLLIIRVLYAILFLFTMIVISYFMVTNFFGVDIGFVDFIFEPGSLPIYFYMLTVDFLLVLLRQINLMLGEKEFEEIPDGEVLSGPEKRSGSLCFLICGHLQP